MKVAVALLCLAFLSLSDLAHARELNNRMSIEEARAEIIRRGYKPATLKRSGYYNCFDWCQYPELEDCSGTGLRRCRSIFLDRSSKIYILRTGGEPGLGFVSFGPADPQQAKDIREKSLAR